MAGEADDADQVVDPAGGVNPGDQIVEGRVGHAGQQRGDGQRDQQLDQGERPQVC